jgi:hypothetical protein
MVRFNKPFFGSVAAAEDFDSVLRIIEDFDSVLPLSSGWSGARGIWWTYD